MLFWSKIILELNELFRDGIGYNMLVRMWEGTKINVVQWSFSYFFRF